MTRREVLALAACAATARAQNANDRRGAAIDLVNQALEQLSWKATPQDVTRAVRFLRGALDQYPNFGDAHYFRALCLKRLNQDPALQRAEMEAAQRYGSEALRKMRDPFFLAVPKIQDHLGPVRQKWALVVGISHFQPDNGGNPLNNAANDATVFANALKNPAVGRFPADQVHCLTNEKATRAAILETLDDIAFAAKPEDLVLVYIATHGADREENMRNVAYLYAYDTNTGSILSTALGMVQFSMDVSTLCAAQRTVVILDTCHSGAGGVAASSEEINRLREGAGRYVLTSCNAGESAADEGPGRFTPSLIKRLEDRKGCISLDDLYAQVARDVSSRFPKQHPQMAKSPSAAEVVLGSPVGGSAGCSA